ncbi:uncharacterized protein F5147DRAFT_707191 [Suillus discolor]|uniref:Uncharacterized protein n=1 Tax=Suillus discolor TaxID=1912936 RepID=A0A9P7JRK6_9AGAM|nr:uncharacterized protein F5147DRAFT_707191 [Suillus discolor]KAG2102508.1 hypothetical protein F5147DRAFT_707191 [Suillus discolor]
MLFLRVSFIQGSLSMHNRLPKVTPLANTSLIFPTPDYTTNASYSRMISFSLKYLIAFFCSLGKPIRYVSSEKLRRFLMLGSRTRLKQCSLVPAGIPAPDECQVQRMNFHPIGLPRQSTDNRRENSSKDDPMGRKPSSTIYEKFYINIFDADILMLQDLRGTNVSIPSMNPYVSPVADTIYEALGCLHRCSSSCLRRSIQTTKHR